MATGFSWILIAQNGRTLARSLARFDDARDADADFRRLAALGRQLRVTVMHAGPRAGWNWRVDDAEGNTVLCSQRSYDRYGNCRRSGHRLLEVLAECAEPS